MKRGNVSKRSETREVACQYVPADIFQSLIQSWLIKAYCNAEAWGIKFPAGIRLQHRTFQLFVTFFYSKIFLYTFLNCVCSHSLQNNWSLGLPLIVMGLIPLISGLMSLLLPETKGKSLPDTLHELRHASLL